MFKINDYLVYGKDVCKVCDVEEKKFNNEDYYLLRPIKDESLKIEVPTSNSNGKIRELITKDNLEKAIKSISSISLIETDDKFIEKTYKELLQDPTPENLLKIIKTTYLRNKQREDNNKKTSEKDTKYFNMAEEYLYNEFSVVLNMSVNDTRNYIINKVENLNAK